MKDKRDNTGRTLIITGSGKGKTTSGIGTALRAVGHGMRVLIIQFLKNDATTGELIALKIFPNVTIKQCGLGFVPKPTHPQFIKHQEAAQQALKLANEMSQSGDYDLIMLDEICYTIALDLIAESAVLELVTNKPKDLILILTGGSASDALMLCADTVSEVRNIKHAYQQNIPAQKGVEF